MFRVHAHCWLPIVGLVLLAGCGKSPVDVSGTVTLDGKALGNANLGFTPAAEGTHAVATTDAEGNFHVASGLIPGEYTVAVVANPAPFDVTKKAAVTRSPIPSKYSNPSTTPLRLTVPGPAELELTSRP